MKDKLLKLIDAYIKDDEVINAEPSFRRVGPDYTYKGTFIYSLKSTQKPLVYAYAYHENKCVFNGVNYIFEIPKIEIENYDYYHIIFSFENEPSIEIINRSEKMEIKKKGFGRKLFENFFISFYRKIELQFEFCIHKKPIHYLKCGSFEFELSDQQVAEIHNKIQNRRLELKNASEMAELNKRFEKYRIN